MAFVSIDRVAVSPVLHRISEFFGDMRKTRAENRLFRRTLAELRGLSDRELNDLGLSRSSLIEVARGAVSRN